MGRLLSSCMFVTRGNEGIEFFEQNINQTGPPEKGRSNSCPDWFLKGPHPSSHQNGKHRLVQNWDINNGDDHSRYLELKFMLLLGDFQNMLFTIFYLGVVVLKFMLVLGESECHLSELSYLCDQGKSET